jgi:hypothetical protein
MTAAWQTDDRLFARRASKRGSALATMTGELPGPGVRSLAEATAAGRGWQRESADQRRPRQRISQATTARVPRRAHRNSQPSPRGRAPLGVGPWSAGGGSVFGAPRGARRDMSYLHDSAITANGPGRPGKRCQVRTTLTGDQRGPPLSTPGPRPRPGVSGGVKRSGGVPVCRTLGAFTAMQNCGEPAAAVRRLPFSNGGATAPPNREQACRIAITAGKPEECPRRTGRNTNRSRPRRPAPCASVSQGGCRPTRRSARWRCSTGGSCCAGCPG